jgi:TusA-related sulfurtransferase
MDIVTLELFDLTVSQAVLEVQRVLDANPGRALRIVMDDEMHKHNVIKLLQKQGLTIQVSSQGQVVTIDVKASKNEAKEGQRPAYLPPAPVKSVEPRPAPIQPVLILSSSIGAGDPMVGRRMLLEILRRVDKQIPWVGIAHEGASLVRDPIGLKALKEIMASGVPVRISKESKLFYPDETSGFEAMEDSEWQMLLLKGNITKL